MGRLIAVLFVVATAASTSTASAQSCAEGMIVTTESAGRCCWPGQRWDDAAGRCSGPPNCPGGWAASGDACVRTTPAVAPAPAPGYMGSSSERYFDEPERTTIDHGLTIAGGVVLGVGYLFEIITGSIYFGAYGLLGFIPVLGGVIWPAVAGGNPYCYCLGTGLAFGLPGAAVQITGLIMLLVGVTQNVPVRDRASAPWAPRLAAGPGEAGAALAWDF